jgi:hypothetical protein
VGANIPGFNDVIYAFSGSKVPVVDSPWERIFQSCTFSDNEAPVGGGLVLVVLGLPKILTKMTSTSKI